MRGLLIFSALLLAIGGAVSHKIVGGHEISIRQRPFQAALLFNGTFGCGGVIISTKWIITAAHYVDGAPINKVSFRVGSSRHDSGGQVVPVNRLVVHPSFDWRTFDYDIALAYLSHRLHLSVNVKPITLPTDGDDWVENTRAIVSGWGQLGAGPFVSETLQIVSVPIVSKARCRKSWYVTDRMVCSGSPGKDACRGDSGGPLTVYNPPVLAGITSFGTWYADASPGVYAHVGQLRSFIRKYTGI